MSEKSQDALQLVYGAVWLHECFAILDQALADGLADEISAIQGCVSVGAARRLQPTLRFTWVPGGDFEDDNGEPLPDDAPYAWSETSAVQDGVWPPMPDAYALDHLPNEVRRELVNRAGAEVQDTTLNGSYFAIHWAERRT